MGFVMFSTIVDHRLFIFGEFRCCQDVHSNPFKNSIYKYKIIF